MKKYDIAGIKIGFTYQYRSYFEDNIEPYQIDDDSPIDTTITVTTVNHIEPPVSKPLYTYKNRHIHHEDGYLIRAVYDDDGSVKILMKHTDDYQTNDILLSRKLKNRLSELEYVLSGLMFMEIAVYHGMFPLHASAVGHKGEAVLFAGTSGTGKSTHANYWRQLLDDVTILNDDKPLIYQRNSRFYAAGTPWSGKDLVNKNLALPVKAIVFLEKAKDNAFETLPKETKLKELLRNCVRPGNEALMSNVLSIIDALIDDVPMGKLYARHDASSVTCVYKKLFLEANGCSK